MRLLSVVLLLICCRPVWSQELLSDTLPRYIIDSIEKELDAFLQLYGKGAQKSYLQLGTGVSNTQASIMNQALNGQQQANSYTVQPTAMYQHKSGFNVAYTGYLLLHPAAATWVQHAVTPGYYSATRHWSAGFYYTRFLGNNRFDGVTSPYQNDWYAFGSYNKGWIQPALALGYSTGRFTETHKTDTAIRVSRPFPRADTLIRYTVFDTLRIRLRDVSATVSVRHQFVIPGKKRNNFYTITPSLLLFFAQNNYAVEYTSASVLDPRTRFYLQQRPALNDAVLRQLQARFPGTRTSRNFLGSSRFECQSAGLAMDAAAYWGKFFINPNLYLDYYLLSGTDKLRLFIALQTGFFF